MTYSIRPATKDDQAAIKSLIKIVGINPLGIKWPRFLVANHLEEGLIGCGQVKVHRDGSRELASIAVHKAWRKQGVARAIISALHEEYPRPLWLTCESGLRSFYEAIGYLEVHELDKMPPYFRRTKRIFNLYMKIRKLRWRLIVMVYA